MVKQFLTKKGKEFNVINLDDEPQKQAESFALSGVLTVPVTTDGNSVVVGYNPANLAALV